MPIRPVNLFAALPQHENAERIIPLFQTPAFRLEHIVSRGQASVAGFWYDAPGPEWVLLLRGQATLDFGSGGNVELAAGDCLLIPAHSKHRVESVSEDAVWLALHFSEAESALRGKGLTSGEQSE